jgi:hypothetical protein
LYSKKSDFTFILKLTQSVQGGLSVDVFYALPRVVYGPAPPPPDYQRWHFALIAAREKAAASAAARAVAASDVPLASPTPLTQSTTKSPVNANSDTLVRDIVDNSTPQVRYFCYLVRDFFLSSLKKMNSIHFVFLSDFETRFLAIIHTET